MLAEYKAKTNIGVGLGILLQIVAQLAFKGEGLGILLGLAGAVLFIWGCCNYAIGKGYHWAFGFFGLLSCLGLLVLIVLPDKHK